MKLPDKKASCGWAPVPHTCNPSYLRGRGGSRARRQPGKKFPETLSRKTLHKTRAGGVAQGEGPEFKPQQRK
jgi:hypothetical protein